MLENIDKVDWANLKHAYGSAVNIPENIRNLASLDDEIRDRALNKLYGNIFHQGSRYEAAPYAIPFLYELIDSESIRDKHKLIYYLISLALGYEEEYLPTGVNPRKFRSKLRNTEADFTSEQIARNREYGYNTEAIIDCYDSVKYGIPILIKHLDDKDEQVRIASTYALSWFPEAAEKSAQELLKRISQISDEIEMANTILSIGLLNKQFEGKIDSSVIEQYLDSSSNLVRICSAIALATNPISEQVLTTLIEGILLGNNLAHNNSIRFNEGRLSGYASITLSEYGKSEKYIIIPHLCKVLEKVNTYQSLDITSSILELLNDQRTKPIKDEKLINLNSIEAMALEAIYKYGGWSLNGGVFINYTELLKSAGIPESKVKLGLYLNE